MSVTVNLPTTVNKFQVAPGCKIEKQVQVTGFNPDYSGLRFAKTDWKVGRYASEWTLEDDKAVLASTDDYETAKKLGRTYNSIRLRRWNIKTGRINRVRVACDAQLGVAC